MNLIKGAKKIKEIKGARLIFHKQRNTKRGRVTVKIEPGPFYCKTALDAGKDVKVKIDVGYPSGGGVRPSEFNVLATIDGVIKPFRFTQ